MTLPFSLRSAKGAEYDSQGQAPSTARRVAPGKQEPIEGSTESAKYDRDYFALSELHNRSPFTQGRRALRLPLAIIFRAFGAVQTEFRLLRHSRSNLIRERGDRTLQMKY